MDARQQKRRREKEELRRAAAADGERRSEVRQSREEGEEQVAEATSLSHSQHPPTSPRATALHTLQPPASL